MKDLVIDSSGWLEYFTEGKLAGAYLKHLRSPKIIWLPTLVAYEVYKKIK
ncbi:MAG: type II toxin-antitoxin system VapC family toxin, partial [Deltaproteobacteria bacterium]|nr:type II toxin-antitoxin system VapC family toxin [Deltaproteobacteria bacterium]